jgi:molybdate transport system ATP-binding protein
MKARARAAGRPLVELERCDLVLSGRKVLDDVTFTLCEGERWLVLGPNGAGKTLLLKTLRGDVWPTPTGRESRRYLHGDGYESQPPSLGERWPYVGPEPQDRYERYGWNFTVRQVVASGLFDEDHPLTTPTRAESAHVTAVLDRFGLDEIARRRFLTLSYGQRRLVMVARAHAKPAPALLLDEVFNGLDAGTRAQLRRGLARFARGSTWIVSAHRPEDVPAGANRLLRLEAGRIIEQRSLRRDDLERLGSRSAEPRVRSRKSKQSLSSSSTRPPWSMRVVDADVYRDYRLVLRQLNWTIATTEHWAILGPNGSGKSTLLKLLYGDLHPALGGRIERDGLSAGDAIDTWKRRVGFVSPELQADHAQAGTLEEVVVSGLRASVGLDEPPTPTERRKARRWLRYFGIEALAARRTRQVSYGQMRLALLARSMVGDPPLLLLDEPVTGLDPAMRATVCALLDRLARRSVQIIMAVHHRDDLIDSITHELELRVGGRARMRRRAGVAA